MTPPTQPTTTPPTYKLSPPASLPGNLLMRSQLLDEIKHLRAHTKNVIAIEARAGSGKTVFAQQYLQQCRFPAGWCQLGREDHDPVALLHVLLVLLQKKLPGFRSQNVMTALEQGSIHHREAPNFGALLAQEIAESSADAFQLVLDDFHLLNGAEESVALITSLIRNTPSWMQWILVSRHSVKEVLQITQVGRPTLIIGNDDLDFSLKETAELLRQIFEMSLPLEQIRRFHRQTEGWATGLILCAMQSERKRRAGEQSAAIIDFDQSRHHLADYFLQDALADFSSEEVEEILRMVLLEEIPLDLLNRLFGRRRTERIVTKMELSNRFFRCLDEQERIYSFHHLFRDSLLPVAVERLPATIRHAVGLEASRFHIDNGQPLRALHYAFENDDMLTGEAILEDFGLELLHRNKLKTLQNILERFALQSIEEHPWLSFYYGACLQDSEPARAYPFLAKAQRVFSEHNNQAGLLATNSQLIEYHTIIDGHFNRMAQYAEELERLVREKFDEFPLPSKIRFSYSLAMGFCFLQADMEKVRRYDTFTLEMSRKERLDNMTAMARIIRLYRYSFVGNWSGAKEELEESFSYLANPRVTALSKLFLNMAQINLVEMMGDFQTYRHLRHRLVDSSANDAVVQSVIRPFIYIWDIDSALAENHLDAAEHLTEKALQESYAASGPHMRSQFLHYQALILALRKKKDDCLVAIHESLQLRKEAGGNAFRLLNHTMLGKAYALLGMTKEAEDQFEIGMQLSHRLEEEFQRTAILAHRAWLRLQTGAEESALQDAQSCLRLMKKNNYYHFFSLMPDSMLPVLKLAFDNEVETGFVRRLLFNQFHLGATEAGDFIPVLEIRLFDDRSITARNGSQLSLHELNKNELALLLSLVEEPENRIDKTLLAERLWPGKGVSKQRTSLDVLLSTLRKKLAPLAAPLPPKTYLGVDQGMIKLEHCRIDALQFLHHIRHANDHLRKEQRWQAGNSFYLAFRLWGQTGLKGLPWDSLLPSVAESKCIQATKDWGSMLAEQGQREEACRLLENGFRQFPIDLELARQLYDLYADRQHHVAAQKVIDRYREALLAAGYTPRDIESKEFAFWAEE